MHNYARIPTNLIFVAIWLHQPASAQSLPVDPSESGLGPRYLAGQLPSVIEVLPESARAEYFPPRPIDKGDAELFVWLSGAEGADAELVRQWTSAVADLDPGWIASHFAQVRQEAGQYLLKHEGTPSTDQRAADLQQLMRRRDVAATELFEKERAYLRTYLVEQSGDLGDRDALVERIMLSRIATSVDLGASSSGQFSPNVIRLLFAASKDPRTSPEAAVALRQLALDNAPRVFELRRTSTDACLKAAYRGHAARARAASRGERQAAAAAPVYRPIAFAAARTAALNAEILALGLELLPAPVAREVKVAFREQAYGSLGEDVFEFDDLAEQLRTATPPDSQARVDELTATDASFRERLLQNVIELFDRSYLRYLQRGRVRDAAESERFLKALLAYHEAAHRSSENTVASIASLARESESWNEQWFERQREDWRKRVKQRLVSLANSGVVSSLVDSEAFPDTVGAITPRPEDAGMGPRQGQ